MRSGVVSSYTAVGTGGAPWAAAVRSYSSKRHMRRVSRLK